MTPLAQMISDDLLDAAYEWLCRRRQQYSANSDIWNFRRRWPQEKQQIVDQLRAGIVPLLTVGSHHAQGWR